MTDFSIERTTTHALVTIHKEKLDSIVAPLLKSELVVLHNDGIKNIILDLSETKYCDSSGLSAILVGNRLCKSAGGKFVICSLSETVKKLISISQLDTILNISADSDEAAVKLA